MSSARGQTFIDAPVDRVWDLVSDVNRHPEWWPRVIDVECEGLEEGCTYRQVTRTPFGKAEMNLRVEGLEDCQSLAIRCLNTGTYVTFVLTEAQDGTFLDSEIGMEPRGLTNRAFDAVAGKRYFKAWLAETMDALGTACSAARRPAS